VVDITAIRKDAERELAEERKNKAVRRVKDKLAQLDSARQIVANIERELSDLYEQIAQGN
jgi:DNA-binding transcriptional regulator GbsR (MarR family)